MSEDQIILITRCTMRAIKAGACAPEHFRQYFCYLARYPKCLAVSSFIYDLISQAEMKQVLA